MPWTQPPFGLAVPMSYAISNLPVVIGWAGRRAGFHVLDVDDHCGLWMKGQVRWLNQRQCRLFGRCKGILKSDAGLLHKWSPVARMVSRLPPVTISILGMSCAGKDRCLAPVSRIGVESLRRTVSAATSDQSEGPKRLPKTHAAPIPSALRHLCQANAAVRARFRHSGDRFNSCSGGLRSDLDSVEWLQYDPIDFLPH